MRSKMRSISKRFFCVVLLVVIHQEVFGIEDPKSLDSQGGQAEKNLPQTSNITGSTTGNGTEPYLWAEILTWLKTPTGLGVSAGVVAVLIFLLLLCFCLCRKRSGRLENHAQLVLDEIEFKQGGMGKVTFNQVKDKNEMPLLIPYDIRLELKRNDITFDGTVLGAGAFGKVEKGKLKGQSVAIKMLNNNPNYMHLKAILSELKMMSFVGDHPNIVKLLGAYTKITKMDVLLVFEYCDFGDLHSYIKKRRDVFIDLIQDGTYFTDEETINVNYSNVDGRTEKLNSGHLLQWACEVATGMEYIAKKQEGNFQVYHGDLASRNILLNSSLTAKIGDFGLAKVVEYCNFYEQSLKCPLPLKWMAIESLKDLKFSIASDVWSFGIMLWEFFELGAVPYPGIDWNNEAWKLLIEGYRMEKPKHATEKVYKIMLDCWESDSKKRPKFSELRTRFEEVQREMKTNLRSKQNVSISERKKIFESDLLTS